jgi:ABC-type Zn uptake system ZnuABC Zn-binding protein ZnuA
MKIINLLLLVGLALGLFLIGGCGGEHGGRLTVVVSILPLKSFVEALAGDHAEVVLLVPPSATPHTFEPKPSDIRALVRARLLVLVGLGLEEPWAGKMVQSANNPKLKVVELAEGIAPIGDPPNPHIWLSPMEATVMVANLEKALIEVDPAHQADYEQNAQDYIKELVELDREYRQAIKELPDKRFIATRPTFIYLMRDYGLRQVAIIAGTPGQEPSAQRLAEIIRLIKEEEIPLLIGLVQVPERFADTIVEETGINFVRLDPLGVEHPDYLELMRANLEALMRGFRGEGG